MSKPSTNDIRINLHIHVADQTGQNVYYVQHIGIFPKCAQEAIVKNLSLISLAYHSGYDRQSGRVDLVVCPMKAGTAAGREIVAVSQSYEPPAPKS